MMRRVWISRAGGPDVLQVREHDDPQPQAGEVRIRVRAAGVNFADVLARQGLYADGPKIPCVVGYEVSGTVDAVGEGVGIELLHTDVVAMTRFGGYSSAVVVPASQVFSKPEVLSFQEAASIPVTYLTAYQLLVAMGGLRRNETVLLHNAGGGVGLAALDIARHIGARTIGTASGHKHDFLLGRGLDHAIDYRTEDWADSVRELTGGRGVELIIDPMGPTSWKQSYRVLRSTGRLGIFGISEVTQSGLAGSLKLLGLLLKMPFYHPLSLLNNNRGVFGVNMGHLWHEGEKIREWMMEILEGVMAGWVRPHVDSSFSFDDAPEAHHLLEQRKNLGKVVLIP